MARSSLADALKPRQTPPAPEPDTHAQCAPSRRGRKAVTIYLDTAAHRQLRMLALEHDSARWGFFSLLYASASGDGRRKYQRSYPLLKLPSVIDRVDPQRDTWISQAEFAKFNRRLVNVLRLGVCFVDLDRVGYG